jgi:ribose-phosphate pyrophosphokinase
MLSEEQKRRAPRNRNGGLTIIPMSGFEGFAERLKERIQTRSLKPTRDYPEGCITPVDIVVPKFGLRPSGEPFPQLGNAHVGGHNCFVITSGPGTYQMMMQLIFVVGYLAARKASRITIISGYFPLARSDKDEGELELALPAFLMIALKAESQGLLKRIVCADPHSDQMVMAADPGVITPVYLTLRILRFVVSEAMKVTDQICLAFPDDTAAKRYEPAVGILEKELGRSFPFISTAARRKSGNEKNIKYIVGDLDKMKDSIVIALDDETATGGSQIKAADRFKKDFGAKEVWAAVTHGVLCGNAPQLFLAPDCSVDRLYITDTIPTEEREDLRALVDSGRLHVMSWVDDCAEVIYHLHWGSSSIRGMRGSRG